MARYKKAIFFRQKRGSGIVRSTLVQPLRGKKNRIVKVVVKYKIQLHSSRIV